MIAVDYLLIGGGPAGCAAALQLLRLQPEAKIMVLEAETARVVRPGESMSPAALPYLTQLGIRKDFEAFATTPSQGIRSIWGQNVAIERHQLFNAAGPGWQLDRPQFHALLREMVEKSGGKILEGWQFNGNCQKRENGWELTVTQTDGCPQAITCKIVIDASGRKAVFAGKQNKVATFTDHLCGVQRFFDLDKNHRMDSFVQVESAPGGWWYSALLPDNRLAVTWFSDSDLIRKTDMKSPEIWSASLAAASHTFGRIAHATPAPALHVFGAMSHCLNTSAGDGWVAAGDAALAYDPLSGLGITQALRSGILAAFTAYDQHIGKKDMAIKKYNYLVQNEYRQYLQTRSWYYSTEQRWPDQPFWARRITSPVQNMSEPQH